jgi:hypothetical protein
MYVLSILPPFNNPSINITQRVELWIALNFPFGAFSLRPNVQQLIFKHPQSVVDKIYCSQGPVNSGDITEVKFILPFILSNICHAEKYFK